MNKPDARALTCDTAAGTPAGHASDSSAASPAGVVPARSDCITEACQRAARVCHECVRALAFEWWDAIARHDIGGSHCELCGHTGGATYCAEHALDAILDHRAHMRELGHRIGEPASVDITGLVNRGPE
jgi:hypothetical protein